jgi:hypothetical protein
MVSLGFSCLGLKFQWGSLFDPLGDGLPMNSTVDICQNLVRKLALVLEARAIYAIWNIVIMQTFDCNGQCLQDFINPCANATWIVRDYKWNMASWLWVWNLVASQLIWMCSNSPVIKRCFCCWPCLVKSSQHHNNGRRRVLGLNMIGLSIACLIVTIVGRKKIQFQSFRCSPQSCLFSPLFFNCVKSMTQVCHL